MTTLFGLLPALELNSLPLYCLLCFACPFISPKAFLSFAFFVSFISIL